MSSNRCEESGSGAAPGERRLLVFRLADLTFAFDLENFLEVADFSEIIHVPGARRAWTA